MWLCSLRLLLAAELFVFPLQALDVLALPFIFVSGDEVDCCATYGSDSGNCETYGGAGNFPDKAAGQQRG
jgi:hypothetical protein